MEYAPTLYQETMYSSDMRYLLRGPERSSNSLFERLLELELGKGVKECRENYEKERRKNYSIFRNLEWVTTLRGTSFETNISQCAPIEFVIHSYFTNLKPMDYAFLTGDVEFATLLVKYGLCELEFYVPDRRSPPRRGVLRRIRGLLRRGLAEEDKQDLLLQPKRTVVLRRQPKSLNFFHYMRHPRESSDEFIRAQVEIYSYGVYASTHNLLPTFNSREFFQETRHLLNEYDLRGGRRCHGNQRGFRRIQLAAKLLNAMKDSESAEDHNFEDFTTCLKLYFRAIKDPFICKEEFQEFLSSFFENMDEDTIEIMTAKYESLFQEIVRPFAPRSLMHLCRCSVRSTLVNNNCILPQTVSSLPCTEIMKRYILGEQ